MKFVLKFYCILLVLNFVHGSHILFISLTPCPSHHIWDRTIALALHEKNHKITFVTHSAIENRENFTVIHFEGIYDKLNNNYDYTEFNSESKYEEIKLFYTWIETVALWDLETKGFQEFLEVVDSNIKFDLIIHDFITAHYLYPIIDRLNVPVIGTTAMGLLPHFTEYFGNDRHTSYVPLFLFSYTNYMNFYERLNNWFYTNLFLIYRHYYYMPIITKQSQQVFGENIKPYQEIEKSFDLFLANFDHVLDYPQSIPPAIIPVGGLHTKREETLPDDLRKILDDSKHGIILFSFGTTLKSFSLQSDKKNALIQGLGRLKQTVIWKIDEEINDLPKNFVVRNWIPQNDILAHPNMKVFLTHGGALSTQEAMYHGVPVLSIPFYMDQVVNTKKIVSRGLGLQLNYGQLTPDIVYKTISEVLNNPVYKKNVADISKRYRDQPEDALTRATWWIEYTIRQNGTQHIGITSKNQPIYVKNLLDIWAFIFTIIIIPIIVLLKYFYTKKESEFKKSKSE